MGRPDQYKNNYPSVTEVIDLLDKPGLRFWYGKYGIQHCERVKKESQELGHHVHDAVEKYLITKSFDTAAAGLTDQETNMLLKFVDWINKAKPRPVMLEGVLLVGDDGLGLFSDKHQFAGTCDYIGRVGKWFGVADWKTDSTPKTKHDKEERLFKYGLQLAAYALMYQERFGQRIKKGKIVRCDKEYFFEVIEFKNLNPYKKLFLMLREIFRALKGR